MRIYLLLLRGLSNHDVLSCQFCKRSVKSERIGVTYYLKTSRSKLYIRFKNSRRSWEFLHLIIHDCEFFFYGFKISDIDQLILALLFLGYFAWSKKLHAKFNRVRHSINIKYLLFFVYELLIMFWRKMQKIKFLLLTVWLTSMVNE